MDHDDILSEHALYLVADAINADPDAAIFYSDEDHIDSEGRRSNPYFKPDWDYDLFLGQNLISHLSAYRADLARQVGGFREGFEGSQDWDFALRVLEASANGRVYHIPFIMYHWRQISGTYSNTALAGARDAAQRAVTEHFHRTEQSAFALPEGHSSYLRVKRPLPARRPLVSIIIPTKDRCDLLRTCIDGLVNRTKYKPMEIIVVDNGSSEPDALEFLAGIRSRENVKVIEDPQPFNFSRLVNRGVAVSSGEVCVLLNNDTDVINPDWLEEMVSHALRPEVAAVGAKLYYADDTLQHGGVILGLGGIAGHAHRRLRRNSPGYSGRLNLTHNLSCVTAACLATRREVYDQIGGFDEQNLTVAFNDVDFCIRARQAGYRVIWTPEAELYHYESLSRGYETTPEKAARFRSEVAYMRQKWGSVLDNDPFYNPNLALTSDSFALAPATRVRKPWQEFAAGGCLQHISSVNRLDTTTNAAPHISCAVFDTVGADPRQVSAVNFVAVYGHPKSGKSSLSRELDRTDGFLWLHSDEIFAFRIAPNLTNRMDFYSYRNRPEGAFNIGTYIDSASYDHGQFIGYLKEGLHRKLQEAPATQIVLLDGYIFKHYSWIFADLGLPPERTLALQVYKVDSRHMVEGFDVTGHQYGEVISYIKESFRTKCLETTVPKSTYQNFDSLGLYPTSIRNTSSNTSAKFDASHLDNLVRASDRFVDIGCNAGYFCFRVSEKTNGLVIGVDKSRRWLEIASHVNNSMFSRTNIAFFESDAVEFLSGNPGSFEIIHCASTYHYFRERQVEFLSAAHRALSGDGTLVLEVELANEGAKPKTAMRSRGVDQTPCAFPNRAMFVKQISGLFRIHAEFKSVFQKGSFYDRVYFHLRPVSRTSAELAPYTVRNLRSHRPYGSYSRVLVIGHSAAGKSRMARMLGIDRDNCDFDRFLATRKPDQEATLGSFLASKSRVLIAPNSMEFLRDLVAKKIEHFPDVAVVYLCRPKEVNRENMRLVNEDGCTHRAMSDSRFEQYYSRMDKLYLDAADYVFEYNGRCLDEVVFGFDALVGELTRTDTSLLSPADKLNLFHEYLWMRRQIERSDDAPVLLNTEEMKKLTAGGYQVFDASVFPPLPMPGSISEKKLRDLRWTTWDFLGKTVVELGSQLGFFGFTAMSLGAHQVLGLDVNSKFVMEANKLAVHYGRMCDWLHDKIMFRTQQLEVGEPIVGSHDIIVANSIVHWFMIQRPTLSIEDVLYWLRENCNYAVYFEGCVSASEKVMQDNGVSLDRYNEDLFLEACSRVFRKQDILGRCSYNDKRIVVHLYK